MSAKRSSTVVNYVLFVYMYCLCHPVLLSACSTVVPAILVRPPALSRTLSSQPLRLTCVAYGIPTPMVTWTTTDGTRNFTAETIAGGASTDNVRIVSRNVTINGTVFLVSVLEVCATDTTYSKTYRCSADNGVSGDAIATSSAEFSVTVVTGLQNFKCMYTQ